MILNVAALVLVLSITFLHSMFGFYSGLINLFCSVTALAVAFGCFEALTNFVATQIELPTSYIEPASLVVLFAVTLTILRTLADQFLRGNVRVPQYLDWAFGAACGFVNAQICVGVLALGFLMLPWGGRVAMYQRYERAPEDRKDPDTGRAEFVRQGLWLGSDTFAAGLFNLLSSGSLKSDIRFSSVYPDFPEWVAWTGNTVQPESFTSPARDKDGDGFKNGLKVDKWWEQPGKFSPETTRYRPLAPTRTASKPPYEPKDFGPQAGHKLLGFRLALNRSAADRDKGSAYHRFRPTQIRLVGDVEMPDGTLEPRQYVAQVLRGADPTIESNYRIVDIDNNFCLAAGGDTKLDLYFEVDERFKPRFVEYRRNARAVPGKMEKTPPEESLAAAPAAAAAGTPTGKSGGPDKASGASRFIDTVDRSHSGDRDDLPFVLAANKIRSLDCDLAGNLLVRGQFSGERSVLAGDKGAKDAITKFQLPEGKRIFQLATKPRKAASIPGQAMNFAGSIANQYFALDDSGDRHMLAGYYAIIKKDGQDFIELFFTPDPEGSGFNGLLDFKTPGIRKDLQDQPDAVLGLIFLVPPGKGIRGVTSQAGKIEFGETFKMGGK
jgi:hypothetical protein